MAVVVVTEIRGYFSAVAVFVFASMIFAESPLLERSSLSQKIVCRFVLECQGFSRNNEFSVWRGKGKGQGVRLSSR